jgi:hypothetical protein
MRPSGLNRPLASRVGIRPGLAPRGSAAAAGWFRWIAMQLRVASAGRRLCLRSRTGSCSWLAQEDFDLRSAGQRSRRVPSQQHPAAIRLVEFPEGKPRLVPCRGDRKLHALRVPLLERLTSGSRWFGSPRSDPGRPIVLRVLRQWPFDSLALTPHIRADTTLKSTLRPASLGAARSAPSGCQGPILRALCGARPREATQQDRLKLVERWWIP